MRIVKCIVGRKFNEEGDLRWIIRVAQLKCMGAVAMSIRLYMLDLVDC